MLVWGDKMYDMGLRLQALRKVKQLTQTQAAKRLHLHPGTVSAYENNLKTPSVKIIMDMALLYGTTTDYILGMDNREPFCLYGLTESQKSIISSLILEFKRGGNAG